LLGYAKTVTKPLKDAVLDFSKADDTFGANENVGRAAESLKSELRLPHIPLRRDGELRWPVTVMPQIYFLLYVRT